MLHLAVNVLYMYLARDFTFIYSLLQEHKSQQGKNVHICIFNFTSFPEICFFCFLIICCFFFFFVFQVSFATGFCDWEWILILFFLLIFYYFCNHLFYVQLDWQISRNSVFRLVLFVLYCTSYLGNLIRHFYLD